MIVEKHLIGQTVIVPYKEDTDSDILGLGFLITSVLMWVSNRRHVNRVCGIVTMWIMGWIIHVRS